MYIISKNVEMIRNLKTFYCKKKMMVERVKQQQTFCNEKNLNMRQFLCRLFHVLGKDKEIAEHVTRSKLLRKTVQSNILLRKTIALNEIQCHDLATLASKSFVENKHLQKKHHVQITS